jgi:hypothetical protein
LKVSLLFKCRSQEFNTFIAKCLVKNPDQRSSAGELLQVQKLKIYVTVNYSIKNKLVVGVAFNFQVLYMSLISVFYKFLLSCFCSGFSFSSVALLMFLL